MRVAALLTCHERRERTLACLGALAAQTGHGADVDVVVVDAGSRDGTAAAVADRFPATQVVPAGPDLFWNGGMRRAAAHVAGRGHDHHLWLNDDTDLDPGALAALLSTARWAGERAVVVGSTRDPDTGALTYGGVRRSAPGRPLRFDLVAPGTDPVPADTMNGNVVLVPRAVLDAVGPLDPAFTHGIGDFDYGLRARRAGFGVWVAPGSTGTCARNPAVATARGPLRELRRLRGPKGLPPREWLVFARRWAGPAWPLYAAAPYARALTAATLTSLRARSAHEAPG